MLTARDTTEDVVRGLDAGADDYLTKPFKFDELLARVRALVRRGGAGRTELLSYSAIELDRLKHKAKVNGKKLDLTPKEFQLLEHFLLRPEEVIRRTDLLEKVWDLHFDPESNVVDVHVGNLRRKLREAAGVDLLATGAWRRVPPAVARPGRRVKSSLRWSLAARFAATMAAGLAAASAVLFSFHTSLFATTSQQLLLALVVVVVLGSGATFVGAWWLAWSAVRPVAEITAQATEIEPGTLNHRIVAHADTEEYRDLVAVLNGMLERLDAAFQGQAPPDCRRQPRAADAAHGPARRDRGRVARRAHAARLRAGSAQRARGNRDAHHDE